jgi:hypothetical protein
MLARVEAHKQRRRLISEEIKAIQGASSTRSSTATSLPHAAAIHI